MVGCSRPPGQRLPQAKWCRTLSGSAVALAAAGLVGLAPAPGAARPSTGSAVSIAAPGPSFVRHLVPSCGFGQVVEAVGVGDLNGDQRPDIVVAGRQVSPRVCEADRPARACRSRHLRIGSGDARSRRRRRSPAGHRHRSNARFGPPRGGVVCEYSAGLAPPRGLEPMPTATISSSRRSRGAVRPMQCVSTRSAPASCC